MTNNFTDEGRVNNTERYTNPVGWPSFISDDKEREAHITKVMAGRRYDDHGMDLTFKPSTSPPFTRRS